MANLHSRSNSLPSTSHPMIIDVEDKLCRIKSSEATSSTHSISLNLTSLTDLHENINNLIQLPSIQQALSHEQGEHWISELLEGSMKLVDLCGFCRDVVCLTKESVQELESAIRRNRGEIEIAEDINVYVASRKKIVKKVNKCIKNLKSSNQNSVSHLDRECDDLKVIATMLKETECLDLSVLNSVLTMMSGEKERSKQRSWPSLLSKFTKSSRVHSEKIDQESGVEDLCYLNIKNSPKQNILNLKQLKSSETTIQELEDGLESFLWSLVKTRVLLLNILSH